MAGSFVPGEILVKFREPIPDAVTKGKAQHYKAKIKRIDSDFGIEHWKIDETKSINDVINALQADPAIAIVEPNYRRFPRAIHTTAATDNNYARLRQVNLPDLWKIPRANEDESRKVIVAIIDDSFDIKHVDLKDNVYKPYDATVKSTDPTAKPCVDSYTGRQSIEEHGTMVMGVIGATVNNEFGIDGAGENALIMPIRISCNYTVSAELEAFNHALKNGANIINLSYGGTQFSQLEKLAITELLKKDILIVAAAGNTHADNDRVLDYPSGLDLPNILAVTATDEQNKLVDWSQWGQTSVDIAGPGIRFYTTYASKNGKSFKYNNGTSFTAPLVAGVIASILHRSPSSSLMDVKAAIMATAIPLPYDEKALLATDGYIDGLSAFNQLSDPIPVPIIESIQIDDSENGNNNGEVNPGESININVTVQNIWQNADFIQAELIPLAPLNVSGLIDTASNIEGFNSETFTYGSAQFVFAADFSALTQKQNIKFQLKLHGTYNVTESFEITRYFTIDTGSLTNNKRVVNIMRKNGNQYDESHYYNIVLDNDVEKLDIILDTNNPNDNTIKNLDLLAKFGSPPLFDYEGDTEKSVKQSDNPYSNRDTITIRNAKAGTYYVVVYEPKSQLQNKFGEENPLANNIQYSLIAKTTPKSRKTSNTFSGGLSLGNHSIQTFILLFVIMGSLRIFITRNEKDYLKTLAYN